MINPILSIQARSQTYILKHFKRTKHARYMKKIKDSHKGESCFIIGNGPSLSTEDLNTLNYYNIPCFAVNRIYKIFPQTEWRPTYYVNTDAALIRDFLEEVDNVIECDKFIPLQNKYYQNIKLKDAHYFFRDDLTGKFSIDCTEKVTMKGTVTIECIELAVHMGYRYIYLLGVDHNFDKIITEDGELVIDPTVKNYFCEGYDDDISNEVQHNIGHTTQSYIEANDFYSKADIKIYNATRRTKLDVFEKVKFEEAIEQINGRRK